MKVLTSKVIIGFGVAGITGASVSGVWYVSRPKDVKSKLISEGLTLVGSSPLAWRAVFLTHKEDSEFMSFVGLTNTQDPKEAGSRVMKACEKTIKVSSGSSGSGGYDFNLSKARKYCTVPAFKTVEAKVLFSGKEPSSSEKDWKDIFTIHKSDSSFISKVKSANSGTNIVDTTTVSEAKEKVRKFCDDLKVKTPESSSVSDYEKYCLQTPANVKDFYEQQGHRFIGEGGWGSKFELIRDGDSTLIDEIKKSTNLSKTSSGSEGGPKLQEWCNGEKGKEINSVDLVKVKGRCFN